MAFEKRNSVIEDKRSQIRQAAENDLITFIRLIAPHRVIGGCHEELCRWWEREDAKSHQMTLLPRDHGKSAFIAYRVAWYITKHPDIRILYLSSTANLAEKQLKFIKDILTSETYMYYWPEMINPEEGKREKWTVSEIAVDHPKRKEEGVRDSTVFTGGMTTSLTGLHCDIAVLDDVVVYENAYTADGREKVRQQYSLLSSIEGADAREWLVGTRYHPNDLYAELSEKEEDIYDKDGTVIDSKPIYEVFERAVENRGDGTGEFLWPRQQRSDGKWFGFDREILAKKRGQYLDQIQFRAQYYNNPNIPGGGSIKRDYFQYYERKNIKRLDGKFYVNNQPVNVFASVDFAFTIGKKSDYTVVAVVGVDPNGNYYVLDIDRFKTESIKEQFDHIVTMLVKWNFKKLRAEANAAQKSIIKELKDNYIKKNGLALSIDEYTPTRHAGTKEERILAILKPRYENKAIWHYQGGNCQVLEDELVQDNPVHDDVKDALASCIEICVPPVAVKSRVENTFMKQNMMFNSRFGGVVYK